MRLLVPTNWNSKLLEALENYPVDGIYGALDRTVIGGGRPTYALPAVTKKEAEEHVEQAHSMGIKFDYIMNAPCLNLMEFDKETHREIIGHLEWINNIGVDCVTVTIPYLIELIKEQFPALKVKVSVHTHINSVQRAKFFEMLGADKFTPDYSLNRDFNLLEKIKKATKCDMSLILNDACLYQCPFRYYHSNCEGHASQTINPMDYYINYSLIRCTLIRFSNPTEMIKCPWIRPEDLHLYEDIGIDYFKISGRSKSTPWILRAVEAYSSRKYNGNLFDILNCMESEVVRDNKQHLFEFLRGFVPRLPRHPLKLMLLVASKMPFKSYKNFIEMTSNMPSKTCKSLLTVYFNATKAWIDNSNLDGFINFFKNHNCAQLCGECDYCEKWAEKVVRVDEEAANRYTSALGELLDDLRTSNFLKII
jgi:collagenase-like PrtC family protease